MSRQTNTPNENLALRLRWHAATGEEMPLAIARLALDRIRRAVDLAESGVHVFVPGEHVRVKTNDSVSLREWDSDGKF